MTYSEMENLALELGVEISETTFPVSNVKGICVNDCIYLDRRIETEAERLCVLAEELAHFKYDAGDILEQDDCTSVKKENLARRKAYEDLVSIDSIIEAFELRFQSREEFADHLGVTKEFLEEAIRHYIDRHGLFVVHQEYVIYFEPFGVLRISM